MSRLESCFDKNMLNELSDFFYGAPIGLQLTGLDGTIKLTNLAELELLGYRDHEEEYVGRHFAEFHTDSEAVQSFIDRLTAGESIAEHETTLLRRDGTIQKVLLYANAKMHEGKFSGVRCFTFPHPDDLRPDVAALGALRDESVESRRLNLSSDEQVDLYSDLEDFFENSPVNLHIVTGDGLVKRANKSELASMGYDGIAYIGSHIAKIHADQAVINGMLDDLVGGTPLVNFNATLFHKNGSKLPVMIYSNSRMRDGSFVNTRCFTVPAPKARQPMAREITFSWPRNEDFGFTIKGRAPAISTPNPMTVALKYIASRKRPEESLGFLAHLGQVLGRPQSLSANVDEAMMLCIPFLADFASVDLDNGHLAHASAANLQTRAEVIVDYLRSCGPEARFSVEAVRMAGKAETAPSLLREDDTGGERVRQLLDLGIRSLIILPVITRDRHVAGTVTFLRKNAPSRRDFGSADHALAEEVARRIAFAIEIERLSKHR